MLTVGRDLNVCFVKDWRTKARCKEGRRQKRRPVLAGRAVENSLHSGRGCLPGLTAPSQGRGSARVSAQVWHGEQPVPGAVRRPLASEWTVGSGVGSHASQNPRISCVQSYVIRISVVSLKELCLIGLWPLAGSIKLTLLHDISIIGKLSFTLICFLFVPFCFNRWLKKISHLLLNFLLNISMR